jgi:acyl carrier protein
MIKSNFNLKNTGDIEKDLEDIEIPKDSLERIDLIMEIEDQYDIILSDTLTSTIKSKEELIDVIKRMVGK